MKLLLSILAVPIVAALVLALLVMWPVADKPKPFASITDPFADVDYGTMAGIGFTDARDGVGIAFRRYEAKDARAAALLLHGSSADSQSMHPLAVALAESGVTAYAIDIRGHGATGLRGDVAHIGQPAEDVEDFLAFMRNEAPRLPISLIGFSSGGGLALNAAGQGHAPDIARLILVSPMLGVDAEPSTADNPNAAERAWAYPDIPRIIGLSILNGLGFHGLDYLPVIVFAAGDSPNLTPVYSHRLLVSMNPQDTDGLLKAVDAPIALLAGDKDEVFASQAYAGTVHAVQPQAEVTLLPGLGHVAMTLDPAALEAIAAAVPRNAQLALR
ncbi:alpha/beta fold hydrolase [Mesorhizobium sp. Z1-4]|uniref:alpha/beta hydrolase n=1 Tax=Mesorhizobium sp. Z1-4 TaxID=2448478 RepID=UPI000FDCC1D3|nr:alpha/beta fold hydrolase [Mesorhizobium sp. Z1-4]